MCSLHFVNQTQIKERDIGRVGGTFHGWNVPGGNPNSCRGSVLSFGRKRALGGVVLTEEGGVS